MLGIPEFCIFDTDSLMYFFFLIWIHRHFHNILCDFLSLRGNLAYHFYLFFRSCDLLYFRANINDGSCLIRSRCRDLHTVCRNMYPASHKKIYIPVDTASGIPSCIFLCFVVGDHHDLIVLSIL